MFYVLQAEWKDWEEKEKDLFKDFIALNLLGLIQLYKILIK